MDFEGKVAVVAGGAAGIGAEIAAALGRRGACVVVGDINRSGAEQTADEITRAGGTALAVEFDIADEAAVAGLFDATNSAFGGVDMLANVAADLSAPTLGPDSDHDISTVPLAVFDRTLDIDLRGYVLTLRQALPVMVARGGGSIVNISSGAAFVGEPRRAAYASAKAAINALTRHVASAFGRHNIRCNSIAPGIVLTEASRQAMGEERATKLGSRNPSGRVGAPADIAGPAVFLLSDDAAWITGQVLSVDGGTTMR
jgi:NAD(P)-dependent dehydrogenase (short-subunit alcohol dehydrogenase family)